MFRTTVCVSLCFFSSTTFAQYYQPSAIPQTNVQVNDFNGGVPQVNVQQGVEYQPRVQAPYFQGNQQYAQPQTQWRPARQPDFYHYHQHEVVQRQSYVQQYQQPQYCVPQTQYYYTYPQQYYCYPQYRTNWWGW